MFRHESAMAIGALFGWLVPRVWILVALVVVGCLVAPWVQNLRALCKLKREDFDG